jgi:hypothetical protein
MWKDEEDISQRWKSISGNIELAMSGGGKYTY